MDTFTQYQSKETKAMKAELKATASNDAVVAQINGDHGAGDVQVFTIEEAEAAVIILRCAIAAAKQNRHEVKVNRSAVDAALAKNIR